MTWHAYVRKGGLEGGLEGRVRLLLLDAPSVPLLFSKLTWETGICVFDGHRSSVSVSLVVALFRTPPLQAEIASRADRDHLQWPDHDIIYTFLTQF